MNLQIIKLNQQLATALAPVLNDHRVMVPSGFHLPANPAAFRWALQSMVASGHYFAITLNQQAIGLIACYPVVDRQGVSIKDQYELGYLLAHQWWGHHIMTHAIRLFTHRFGQHLWARVALANRASATVLANCGFKRQGLDRGGLQRWSWQPKEGLATDRRKRV